MALRSLLGRLAQDPAGAQLIAEGGRAFVSSAMRPYAIAAVLGAEPERPGLVVAGDDREAQELAEDLSAWLAPRPVLFYPSRGVAYESHLSPPPHLVGLRVAALDALLDPEPGEPPVVVASAVALSEKLPDPSLRPRSFTLERGGLIDLDEVARALVEAGYRRGEEVTERGQFAIRGGILDCFPATGEHPVRVDCFDIEIESIREFSVFTQRSLQEVDEVRIAPAAELSAEYREEAEIATVVDAEDRPDISELLPVDRFVAPLELVGPEAKVVVAAEEEISPALGDHWQDVCASIHDEDARHLYLSPEEVSGAIEARAGESFSSLASGQPVELHAQAADFAARSIAAAEPELETLVRGGYRTVVTFGHRGEGERAAYNLARLGASWLGEGEPSPPPGEGSFSLAEASLRSGFVAAGARLAVIPDHRLLRRRPARHGGTSRRGRLAAFGELAPGDYVVHEDHGIARLAGFETKTVAGVTRDYLQLEYAGSDRVFLPVEQLTKVGRYVGAGDGEPKLSKLGGKAWETLKARARRAAQDLAGELLNLYADRRRHSGHSFPADSAWQMDFEGRFSYRETVDQAEAIDAVKEDMEAPRPMDRLICGDVGYGKTEVALRAAFKAADDGRQVLVLAPTTILAQQHFGTFSERLADFPFTVDVVSRLRSAAEQKASVEAFNEGRTDILIGTHRLLGRDLRPKELGLLVVDEEQRFGVRQKELLRQLKLKVDVISMSATPIPRTLQMSLAGVRDISVIETPPEGRRPVRTYVGEYDEELVRTALEREKERGGQAFFLHNRVETIEETAARLRGLCPDLTFAVAHGQLDDGELEDRMMAFLRGDVDVLVATSIIESGIDIPQANTLIVERADLFGLSQLYQIRGRVGRSRQRAYAYLLYPSAAALSDEATRRLSALSDYTELGAGFKIAMRDLEIRGAGNLLGDEQSGHVAALGFELYLSMLDDAVREAGPAGEAEPREPVRVDVDVDVFIPGEYVPFEQARIDIHRRVAAAAEVADLGMLREELEDRFGPAPQPVLNLLALQEARVRFGEAGVRNVGLRGGRLSATPVVLEEAAAASLARKLPAARYEPGRSLLTLEAGEEPAAQLAQVDELAGLLASLAAAGPPDGA